MLTAVSMFRSWITLAYTVLSDEQQSFLLACDLIGAIQFAKFHIQPSTIAQHATIIDSMWRKWAEDRFKASPIPQNHWLGHVGDQLREHGVTRDTFVTERLVRRTKRHCKDVVNTRAFERSALSSMFAACCVCRTEPTCSWAASGGACTVAGQRFKAGCFVRNRDLHMIGEVLELHPRGDNALLVVQLRKLLKDRQPSPYWAFVCVDDRRLTEWPAGQCDLALGWKRSDDHTFVLFRL